MKIIDSNLAILFLASPLVVLSAPMPGAAGKAPDTVLADGNRFANTPSIQPISDLEYLDIQQKAQYALLTYCANFDSFAPFTCSICSTPLESRRRIASEDGELQGYVGVNPLTKTIYFGFQGAIYLSNWIAAAQFPRTPLAFPSLPSASHQLLKSSGASVLTGFLNSYLSFRPAILGNLTLALNENPGYNLEGVGHSYGGPLITFLALDLVLNNLTTPQQISLTTFGCPRTGNFEFSKLVSSIGFKSVRRVVHSLDAIVHYPPTTTGFRHHGVETWLDVESKKVYKCMDVPAEGSRGGYDESPSCSNAVGVTKWSTKAHSSYFDTSHRSACPATTNPLTVKYMQYQIYETRQ
ncbi:hypothetical protein HDV05_004064 [Chytridiales sp. JEL 0842]|nr:hypothetical protein HDV05_004064 [Chytridiales sp. JEL 0842]